MAVPRVFVSHSHEDVVFCRAFVEGLRVLGVDVWYDEHNLGSGALRREIERELPTREHFIAILSPHAVDSQWVNDEIDAALHLLREGQLKTFLPVVAIPCEIPLLLQAYKRVERPDGTRLRVEEAVARVSTIISPVAPMSNAGEAAVTAPRVQPARQTQSGVSHQDTRRVAGRRQTLPESTGQRYVRSWTRSCLYLLLAVLLPTVIACGSVEGIWQAITGHIDIISLIVSVVVSIVVFIVAYAVYSTLSIARSVGKSIDFVESTVGKALKSADDDIS